jgi:hypothetical protein
MSDQHYFLAAIVSISSMFRSLCTEKNHSDPVLYKRPIDTVVPMKKVPRWGLLSTPSAEIAATVLNTLTVLPHVDYSLMLGPCHHRTTVRGRRGQELFLKHFP